MGISGLGSGQLTCGPSTERRALAVALPTVHPRKKLCLSMAILGQFPPNLVFLIGILRPVRWTVTAARPWSRSAGESAAASPTRSASKAPRSHKRSGHVLDPQHEIRPGGAQ